MDFEPLLSGYKNKTCIMSVELFPDGKYGNIRIAAGNRAHYDAMMNTMHLADEKMYIDKREYYEEHPERKYR